MVKCTWDYRLYPNDKFRQQTVTWYFTCRSNPVYIFPEEIEMEVGDSYPLTYGFSYDNDYTSYADAYFSCTSSCVSVTQRGRVTALEPGTAYVNVYSKISANTPYCKVTVKEVPPTNVSLTAPDPIYIGQTVKLTPRLYPSNAQTTYSWSSSNKTVATVSSGSVTGQSAGTARITVTTANGLSASCDVEVYKPVPSRIELKKPTLRLPVGGTETLAYEVTPSYAIYEVSWESDASDVVSVSNGRLEAKKSGTAHITVTTDNGKSATCEVIVPPEPTAMAIEPNKLELAAGKSRTLSYSFTPDDAATRSLTWESDAPNIASVNQQGVVTANAEGTARISAKTANGVLGYCDLTVFPAPTSINISKTSLQLHVDDVTTLSYSVLPTNAVYEISWQSSNPDVALVNDSGEVTAKSQGTTNITVSTDNGLSASCKVSVHPVPSGISLNKTSLKLIVGETDSLFYTVTPPNALYTVSWSSDAPGVASVTEGRVEAKSAGTAHISVKTDNSKSATCEVIVPPEPRVITVTPARLELFWGRTARLTYAFTPADAETLSLTWESSNPEVATVTQKGLVRALTPGHATLTLTARNGVVGKCELTVPEPLYQLFVWSKSGLKTGYLSSDEPHFSVVGDIVRFTTSRLSMDIHRDTLDKFTLEPVLPEHPKSVIMSKSMTIPLGESEQLSVTLRPSNAKTRLTWFNDNPEVVSVTQEGLVTALAAGEANVRVQTSNGLRATCRVTVPEPFLRFFVWLWNGNLHGYDLDEHPKVEMGESVFTLRTSRQTVQYRAADIEKFTLQDEALVDGVSLPKAMEEAQFREGALIMAGGSPYSPVQVYDAAGRLVQTATTDGEGNLSLSLASLRAGIYIICTDKTTIKIQKR